MQIAIDSGGTFTDCIYKEGGALKVLKVFSTPGNPGTAVMSAIRTISNGGKATVRHGTTVGTNALLERKGARVAFVTTAGFEDIISIGRQARANLYDWFAESEPCIVPPDLRFGITERTAADGTILQRAEEDELRDLAEKIRAAGAESIALCLLFSFANPGNEIAAANVLRELGLPLSLSHVILPEFREYERASTVTVNAYLSPKVGGYLQRLDDEMQPLSMQGAFEVMQSSGGIIPARFAAEQPVRTVLSGPAGGVVGAYRLALQSGFSRIISFDMGGTSTDVALIDGAQEGPRTIGDALVSQLPISVPMLDIHTIGAGGGSLARFDAAGIMHVGPESAGAAPGPICYGHGTQPTVTDANLILGRLHPDHFLGGTVKLDVSRTRSYMEKALGPLATPEELSGGIALLAEAAMERAIRVISVERGHDPREFTLVAFGGAGPLHACALAKALRMPRVLIPAHPGALSALGILLADTVRDYSKTVMLKSNVDLEPQFKELEKLVNAGTADSAIPSTVLRSLDLRYAGQGYELNVPAGTDFLETFHRTHQKRYGYADERKAVEIVSLRLRVTTPGEAVHLDAFAPGDGDASQALLGAHSMIFDGKVETGKVYQRELLEPEDRLIGPALVVEYSATTVLPPGWTGFVDDYKNLLLEVSQ
ncbi:MAG TPA: hydantoinase/oxoprolinase family protein [Candidatus Angelobacter sp.]|nr:hydantoinase/oxoprolinase family protein [Candidatus Angelobacter sp.]